MCFSQAVPINKNSSCNQVIHASFLTEGGINRPPLDFIFAGQFRLQVKPILTFVRNFGGSSRFLKMRNVALYSTMLCATIDGYFRGKIMHNGRERENIIRPKVSFPTFFGIFHPWNYGCLNTMQWQVVKKYFVHVKFSLKVLHIGWNHDKPDWTIQFIRGVIVYKATCFNSLKTVLDCYFLRNLHVLK